MKIASWEFESPPLHYHIIFKLLSAEIAQLVEHNLAKVGVASSSLVFRSQTNPVFPVGFVFFFVLIFVDFCSSSFFFRIPLVDPRRNVYF